MTAHTPTLALEASPFDAAISKQIWEMKYRFQKGDEIMDKTVQDSWMRIASALAEAEVPEKRERYTCMFYDALENFQYLPAGRITAGAGTGRSVTLFNCFVMGTIPDSMDGIFDMLKEAALTMQAGGGIGYDFSTIRPKGTHVRGVDADASGPLSFMDVWDAMCRTIMSAGSRRGAMMATMRCDHPDIEDFITSQARQQAPAHVQPLGSRHGSLHGRREVRRQLGPGLEGRSQEDPPGARAVGPHHEIDLRLRRTGRHLH